MNSFVPEMSFARELWRIAALVRFDEGEHRDRAIADIPWLVCAMQESIAWTWFPRLMQSELVEACELSARLILSRRGDDRLARWVLAQAMDRAAGICDSRERRAAHGVRPVAETVGRPVEFEPSPTSHMTLEGATVAELSSMEELLRLAMSPDGAARPVDCPQCARFRHLLNDALGSAAAPAAAQVVDALQVHMVLGHGVEPPPGG
ncbi:hypothetical protein AAHZ94_14730 [Streptomyces sp. HSW2009]|uniref:hypothetical protein n=1 Tax=Streptomyces sp. HSW2009 TaxID=3142890 RepID=UPI0032ECDD30